MSLRPKRHLRDQLCLGLLLLKALAVAEMPVPNTAVFSSAEPGLYCRVETGADGASSLVLTTPESNTDLSTSRDPFAVLWSGDYFVTGELDHRFRNLKLYKVGNGSAEEVSDLLSKRSIDYVPTNTYRLVENDGKFEVVDKPCSEGGVALTPTFRVQPFDAEGNRYYLLNRYDPCSGMSDEIALANDTTTRTLYESTGVCRATISPDSQFIAVQDILDHHYKELVFYRITNLPALEAERLFETTGEFGVEYNFERWRTGGKSIIADVLLESDYHESTTFSLRLGPSNPSDRE